MQWKKCSSIVRIYETFEDKYDVGRIHSPKIDRQGNSQSKQKTVVSQNGKAKTKDWTSQPH